MSRHLVAVWKGDDQPHSDVVVRHAGLEEETVASKVNHLAYILEIRVARVERSHVQGKRNFQSLPAARVAAIASGAVPARFGPFRSRGIRGQCFREWHVAARLEFGMERAYSTLVLRYGLASKRLTCRKSSLC